jgi:hypothetical protein
MSSGASFTDGRSFPAKIEPSFAGYSIGKWLDTNGDGKYDTLEAETRGFKGPRIYEPTGIPLHDDNQTVIKERIALDPADANVINDEITTIDNALTRPWTVTRQFKRVANPAWAEYFCQEHNTILILQKETYFIREDGVLMPSRKDQPGRICASSRRPVIDGRRHSGGCCLPSPVHLTRKPSQFGREGLRASRRLGTKATSRRHC